MGNVEARTRKKPAGQRSDSLIGMLPADLREMMKSEIMAGNLTQTALHQMLKDFEAEGIIDQAPSLPTLNRYARDIGIVAERMEEAQKAEDALLRISGEKPSGRHGQILVEITRTLLFNTSMGYASDDEAVVDPATLRDLSYSLLTLEKAETEREQRDRRIQRDILARAAARMEEEKEKIGLDTDQLAKLKAEFLGLSDEDGKEG